MTLGPVSLAGTDVLLYNEGQQGADRPAMDQIQGGVFTMSFVAFEQRGPIGVLTMNRPEALNALNEQVLRDLNAALDAVEANDEVLVVILTGAELFTGNCLISISVLERKASLGGMLRSWGLVYLGNFGGALALAAACAFCGQLDYSGGALAVYTVKTAAAKCALPCGNAVVLGVLCNILVCAGVMCSLCAKDVSGRAVGAFVPVCVFVLCGFEHCVANMYYVPAGIFAISVPRYARLTLEAGVDVSALTWGSFLLHNLLPVTLGNILGGAGLGALLWACHGKRAS